jgi:hypothetical protein
MKHLQSRKVDQGRRCREIERSIARELGTLQSEPARLREYLSAFGQCLGRSGSPRLASPAKHRVKPMSQWGVALRRTFVWPSVRRSLLIAVIVGTAVNAINQGPELLAGQWPVMWKLALTYLMPFLVVSYGTYAAFRAPQ